MNVVLYQPEIPANTGNVARLCVVTGCKLHLIRPLGFFLDDKRVKRAGLDYWDQLDLAIHDSWPDFLATVSDGCLYFIETDGAKNYSQVNYTSDDYLVFGSETKGISQDILRQFSDYHVTLPMVGTRSLNLSNTVAVVVYEAWRQLNFRW